MQIKFDNVFYTYNAKTPFESDALNGIDLTIEEGGITALVGKTGSGKSTLAQHINGLILPTKGKVFVRDFVLSGDKKSRSKNYKMVRKTVGLVFQFPEYQLFEETVKKDISFGPKNFKCSQEEIDKRVKDSLALVDLDESFLERSPFDLSGGEKRRVAIAGILACKPEILIVDEPTAGLDPLGCKSLMLQLKKLADAGMTIIIVTHDMEGVSRYADNVVVMENGKVVFQGKPFDLFKDDVSKYNLDTPQCYLVAKDLKKKGLNVDLQNFKGISSLVDEIVRVLK